MKSKLAVAALLITLFFGAVSHDKAYARTSVSFGLFFDSMSLYGNWVEVPDYGYAWYPAQVGPHWQPYTDGRWEWSDQGWLWISYEPWGWATYHYGRWIYDDYYGWIWIPGTVWAPAWVSWYQSPGYIGWSPLPPNYNFFIEIGISFYNYGYGGYYYGHKHHHHHKKHHYYDNDYYPHKDHYVFVPEHKFTHKNASLVALDGPHDLTVIRNVKNVTNIKVVNNKIVNHGPDKGRVERATNRKLNKLNLVDRDLKVVRGKKDVNNVRGSNYNVYRPKVEKIKGETPFDRGQSAKKNSGVREIRTLRPGASDKNYNNGGGKANNSLRRGPVQKQSPFNRNNPRYSNQRADYGIIREEKVNRNSGPVRNAQSNIQKRGHLGNTPKQVRTRANSPAFEPKNNRGSYAENNYKPARSVKRNSVNVNRVRTENRSVRQNVNRSAAGYNQRDVRNHYTAGPGKNRKVQSNTIRKQQNSYKSTQNKNYTYKPNQNRNAQTKSVSNRTQRSGYNRYSNTGAKVTNNYSNFNSRVRSRAVAPRSFGNNSFVKSAGRR